MILANTTIATMGPPVRSPVTITTIYNASATTPALIISTNTLDATTNNDTKGKNYMLNFISGLFNSTTLINLHLQLGNTLFCIFQAL